MSKNVALLLVLVFATASFMTVANPALSTEVHENSWATKTSMPATAVFPGAAVLNGKIYVVVSYSQENKNNSLYEYNPTIDVWTIKKSMPSSSVHFAIASCNNRIFIMGGLDPRDNSGESHPFSTNEAYNPVTDSWETRASMPTARSSMVAETVNDKVYVIGGRTAGAHSTVTLTEVYDSSTDSWTQASPIPTPVAAPTSAVVDNRIYVIGGQAEFNTPMNPGLNQIYDPQTDIWIQGAKEPNPAWVDEVAGATTGQKAPKMIYVMGGRPGFAPPLDQNYAYNPKEDKWIVAASLPAASSGFAVAVVNDLLYVMGGTTVNLSEITASVKQYTPFGYYGSSTSTPTPTSSSTSTASPAPFPIPTPSATTVAATTDSGNTVDLTLGGNVSSSQMSNVTISTNQSAAITTVSFIVTGQSGNTGFSNITIPISIVSYGTTLIIYIDGQPASNQGYTQDGNNYYVWYITQFSAHEISIVFTAKSIPEFPSLTIVLPLFLVMLSIAVILKLKKQKPI